MKKAGIGPAPAAYETHSNEQATPLRALPDPARGDVKVIDVTASAG
ncbi:hypothetical protein ACIBI9_66735 [Nonomuraea sp. NPDC050451]